MAGRSACIRWNWAAWSSFPGRHGGRQQSSPAWSADGTKIAFSSSRIGRSGDLGRRRQRRQSAPAHQLRGTRCRAHLESAHQRADGLGERAHRPAADLHHGPGRRQRAAHDRRRLCHLPFVVAQRRSCSPSVGTASTAPARPAARTSTSWTSPASAGCSSPTMRAATTFPSGRRTSATSSSSGPSASTREIWSMLADGTEQHQLTQDGQQLHAQLELEVEVVLAPDGRIWGEQKLVMAVLRFFCNMPACGALRGGKAGTFPAPSGLGNVQPSQGVIMELLSRNPWPEPGASRQ